MRYAPIILKCENCGVKNEKVKACMTIKLNTSIIDTAYLNKWTHLCNECEQKIATEIEQRLSNWPKGIETTETA